MQMSDFRNRDAREWALRILATLGLIAILALGAWGIARLAMSIPSVLSAIGAAAVSLSSVFIPNERLEIELASGAVKSGEPFELKWSHVNKRGEGSYTVLFACREGLSVEASSQDGSYQKAFCETPFNFTNAKESIKLIPTSNVRFLDVPFTVSYTRLSDGSVTASSEATVTVMNEGAPSSIPTTTPPVQGGSSSRPGGQSRSSYVITTAGRASDPSGKADLTVKIISLGVLNASNTFIPSQSVRAGEKAAVKFEIENAGTKTADYWTFNAVLPTSPFHIFHSEWQPSLGPGDKVQYTLGFDQIDTRSTGGVITLNVDPSNSIRESAEYNNIVKGTYIILIP